MEGIKQPVRRLRENLRRIRDGVAIATLEAINFESGLGDSAYLLYGLVKSIKPQVVVEIGSARGRSACFMGMALKENGFGKLFAIDPHTKTDWNDNNSVDTHEVLRDNLKKLHLESIVEVLRETSDLVASRWTLPIDLIFIDGDHSYEGVKRDWTLFMPFVQTFGGVVFHDTLWSLDPTPEYARPDMGVPRFVEELRVAGYPVITINRNFGVSLVQPVKNGIALEHDAASQLVSGASS